LFLILSFLLYDQWIIIFLDIKYHEEKIVSFLHISLARVTHINFAGFILILYDDAHGSDLLFHYTKGIEKARLHSSYYMLLPTNGMNF
ncbi:hypothetical protein ACJX0J_022201, partial [Zea mays]